MTAPLNTNVDVDLDAAGDSTATAEGVSEVDTTSTTTAGDADTDWKSQAEAHKAESRKWEALAKKNEQRARAAGTAEELEQLRKKAAEYDALAAASMTEHEKALAAARAEAAAEATAKARGTYTTRLVTAQFTAALAGRMDADARSELLEGLDLGKFLDADGEVDPDRVQRFADRIAPAAAAATSKDRQPADLGQGRRPPAQKERPSTLMAAVSSHYTKT